jgi:spermidine/putrescine transport system substrate-binding protein
MRDWDARSVSRRDFLRAGAAAAVTASLYGCGTSASSSGSASATTAATLASAPMEHTLEFHNWAQYVNPTNVAAFSKKFGINFHESNYTSNEQLLTQLNSSKGQKLYDIIVPDADHVNIEKSLGLLMPLTHALIPNMKYLAPHWRSLPYDPGNVYSVVKDTGITGFTLRTDRVKATLESWKDFFDFLPHANGLRVNFIESPAEVIGVALNSLGHSMNTADDAQLNQVKELMLKIRPYVTTINEAYINDFIAGTIDLGITYSGDGIRTRQARSKQNDILVVAPHGKSELWTDNWSISAYSPDPIAAHAWINFILDPVNNAKEMAYNQYEVPTPASYPLVGAAATDPLVVFGPQILDNYEVLQTTADGLRKRVAIWTQFKAA